jgi:hypothetical protein
MIPPGCVRLLAIFPGARSSLHASGFAIPI